MRAISSRASLGAVVVRDQPVELAGIGGRRLGRGDAPTAARASAAAGSRRSAARARARARPRSRSGRRRPDCRVCTSAPPSSSAVTSWPVAAFTSGGPPMKIVPVPRDDHRLVAHRRHVGAARGARAHHDRDLRDPRGRHPRLVEEDPAEVVAVGKDLGLERQERAARVDEVDARQPVLLGDLLGAQVLLHRQREVGAALHRRVVGDDHALAPLDDADPGHDPGARRRRRRRRSQAASAFSSRNAVPGSTSRSIRSRAGSLPRDAVALDRRLAAPARDERSPLA